MILTPPLTHPLPYRLLIFDADGTLRGCTAPGRPPNTPEESVLLPGVDVVLQRYGWKKTHYFGLASNQGGVALGYMPEEVCKEMLLQLMHDATWFLWPADVIRYCPHDPQDGCRCRKPGTAMLNDILLYWHKQGVIGSPQEALYVGDQDSDREAAERAGIAFAWAHDFFGWEQRP